MKNIFLKRPSLLKLIVFFSLFLLSLILFVSISEDVIDKESLYFIDTIVQNIVTLFVSSGFTSFMIAFTDLGSIYFLGMLSLIVVLYLWWINKFKYMIFYLFTLGVGELIIHSLKVLFQRERPLESIVNGTGYSYPSGHAFSTMLVFGLLIFLSSVFVTNWKIRLIVIIISTIIILGVGFSRIYLGVHWFSDVVGGYIVAFSWLMFCINLFRFRKYRNN